MTREELKEKAADLPLAPGVYLMMDKTGKVIYVGKAKKLKNRVSQYFQDNTSHNTKTKLMVSQVDHFDTIFVSSEFEALILENSLIKRHNPKYNILLKDDKGYPFIRLSPGPYPRFSMVNRQANDGARYFGPFGGRYETRQAIDAICNALKLPTCSRQFPRDIDTQRPCLNFHMGRCDGFCRSTMSQEEYAARMEQAAALLSGKSKQMVRELKEQMEQAAEELRFEQAAALRDRMNAVEVLSKRQSVIAGICADTDLWGLCLGDVKSCYAVLHVEEGHLTGRETAAFTPQTEADQAETLAALRPSITCPGRCCPGRSCCPSTPGSWRSSRRSSPAGRATGSMSMCPSGERRRSCLLWPSATPLRRWSGSAPSSSARTKPWSCCRRCWIFLRRRSAWRPTTSPTRAKATSWLP